jgi:hypothetical protein
MITGTLIAVALFLGYVSTVACSLLITFALTSAYPAMVSANHRITANYKRVQTILWLMCVIVGSGVTYAVAQGISPLITGIAMAAGLIAILWLNTWEARQRGMAHQILMSVMSILGVIIGYRIADSLLKL